MSSPFGVTDFRFFQFAYPYDWYPDYDYGYPHDYSYYDYSPVFGNGYSSNLVMLVQSKLARRGYYDGPINGLIDSGSRRAIREFQTAEGLPITGPSPCLPFRREDLPGRSLRQPALPIERKSRDP